jgi:hypothetical protein
VLGSRPDIALTARKSRSTALKHFENCQLKVALLKRRVNHEENTINPSNLIGIGSRRAEIPGEG